MMPMAQEFLNGPSVSKLGKKKKSIDLARSAVGNSNPRFEKSDVSKTRLNEIASSDQFDSESSVIEESNSIVSHVGPLYGGNRRKKSLIDHKGSIESLTSRRSSNSNFGASRRSSDSNFGEPSNIESVISTNEKFVIGGVRISLQKSVAPTEADILAALGIEESITAPPEEEKPEVSNSPPKIVQERKSIFKPPRSRQHSIIMPYPEKSKFYSGGVAYRKHSILDANRRYLYHTPHANLKSALFQLPPLRQILFSVYEPLVNSAEERVRESTKYRDPSNALLPSEWFENYRGGVKIQKVEHDVEEA